MDKLQERAFLFKRLLDYEYKIVLGRKGKTFIQENNIAYTYGQTKMTLLYKEKINKITGQSEIQYDRLSNK